MTSAAIFAGSQAVDWVRDWCTWYTRGIQPDAAEARRSEIESDLFEHSAWAREAGVGPGKLSRSILGRAIRGVPGDLSWRRSALKKGPTMDAHTLRLRRLDHSTAGLAFAASGALLVFGLLVIARTLGNVASGAVRANSDTFIAVVVFTALAAFGLILLARQRTRFLGALWMIVATWGLLHFGLYALSSMSATVGGMFVGTMLGTSGTATNLLAAGIALCFAGAAVAWWPRRAAR